MALYFANVYSRRFKVSDEWTLLRFENTVSTPVEKVKNNIQRARNGFYQWSEDDKTKYLAGAHQAMSNATLPTISNLDDDFKSIQKSGLATRIFEK